MPKKAEQTEAVVVDQMPSLVISQMQPGLDIIANFDELDAKIAAMVAEFGGMTVEQGYLKEAKGFRAYLNGQAKTLDTTAKELEQRYSAPAKAFRARVKQSIEPILEASRGIDEQVKAFEEQERQDKYDELRKHYNDCAGALAEPIPYERIADPSWLLRGTNLMAAFKAIEDRVEGIVNDHHTLSTLGLAYEEDAKAEYIATLSLSLAIARSKAIEERMEAARALEEAKAANIAANAAEDAALASERLVDVPQDAEPVPAPPRSPETHDNAPLAEVPAEAVEWTFRVTCTRLQLGTIIAAIKALGFTGTVSR